MELECPSLVGCAVGELAKVRLVALLPASGLYGKTFATCKNSTVEQ